jgi:SAM-dependent methyltransferase
VFSKQNDFFDAVDQGTSLDGFDTKHFKYLAELEESSFWFQARNDLIVWLLSRFASSAKNFLEIGCGTGFVLSGIHKRLPYLRLYGSELFIEGLAYAQQRVAQSTLFQMDARQIPHTQEFDCVGAFDVLEHVQEDTLVLSQINKALTASGVLILTVPQHRWLWSQSDVAACHKRRYTRHDLVSKLRSANFEILYVNSFVLLLLPLMLLLRTCGKNNRAPFDPYQELRAAQPFFKPLLMIMKFELSLIQCGLAFPVGGSLVVVARKSKCE